MMLRRGGRVRRGGTPIFDKFRVMNADMWALRGAGGALRLARELRPDVNLLDYAMPDMDGAEISRRLRADPTTAAIPISLMSAHEPAARPRMPVDDTLLKPFDLERMLAAVARWKDTTPRRG